MSALRRRTRSALSFISATSSTRSSISRGSEDPLRPHIYEVARIPDGGKAGNFHFPLTLDGYRAVYKGYLADPDLQDARARWPFVAIWDNHEFSWQGWQSIQKAGGRRGRARASRSPRTRPGGSICRRGAEIRRDVMGTFRSACGARCRNQEVGRERPWRRAQQPHRDQQPDRLSHLRYGKHLDLIITDQHSYRSPDPFSDDSLEQAGRLGSL